MSTQINIQKILSFNSVTNFPPTGLDGYIYLDNTNNIGYLWDAVANQYVNIAGVNNPIPPDPIPLAFANAATVGALSYSPVYNNGTLGVGATLTATVNGVLRDTSAVGKIDTSYTPVAGDIVLIKNQASALQNGLYTITTVGSVSTPYVLTRVVDFNESAELYPLQVNVISGNSNTLKYFIQTTVNPIIGTSNLVFSLSTLQSTASQIAFIDTVIDTALSNIVYANGTAFPTIPGSGATLTSTVNGALGTYYGLTANTNSTIAGGFTRVLLINQTNPAYNGDYQVINAGSASTRWQLRRIQTTAGGFDRYTRYFTVSNVGSTKAGKIYFTKPNSPVLTNATIGTAAINIFEYGGASFGPFGIANSSGVYTYYNTFTLAIAAATSGQTVEIFADIIETGAVTITLKDGVNINGNGHTYTLNNSGLIHAFLAVASTVTSCNINNLNVIRTGSTGSIFDNSCLILGANGSGIINCAGSTFKNSGSGCGIAFNTNSVHEINYAVAYATTIWGAFGIFTSAGAKLNNCIGYGTSGGFGIRCHNGGDIQNCTGVSDSGYGIFASGGNQSNSVGISTSGVGFLGSSSSYNCIGRSISGVGFDISGAVSIVNCVGVSTSGVGLSASLSNIYNCTGISSSSRGMHLLNGTIAYSIISKSSSNYSILANASSVQIYTSTIISEWNNAGGIGISSNTTTIPAIILNSTFLLSNASAPYLFNNTTAQAVSTRGNTYKGGGAYSALITQAIVATEDNQGNIYL